MNEITRLVFESAYLEDSVKYVTHYVTETPPIDKDCSISSIESND